LPEIGQILSIFKLVNGRANVGCGVFRLRGKALHRTAGGLAFAPRDTDILSL